MAKLPTYEFPVRHRGYRIYLDGSSPFKYAYVHEDYDGAPDGNDNRYGYADTIEACCAEIDDKEDD